PQTVSCDFPFLPPWVTAILSSRDRTVLLMPSRLSNRWKGSDLFVDALVEVATAYPERLFLIAAGWGDDYPAIRARVQASAAAGAVYFMEGALSKGYLSRLLNCVDAVVDQFVLGWYGAVFIEAAAHGRPVLIHLDREQWQRQMPDFAFPSVPP